MQKPIHPIDAFAGKQLRDTRKALELTQDQLAQQLESSVTFQQLQKYERGTNRLSASRLWEIAQIFNVPPEFFFPPSTVEPIQCVNIQEVHLLQFFRQLSLDKQSAVLALMKPEGRNGV